MRHALWAAAAFTTLACGGSPGLTDEAWKQEATASASVVVFSRSRFFGRSYYPFLFVDGQLRGLVMSGGYIGLALPPGRHTVVVEGVAVSVDGGSTTTFIEVAPAAFKNEPRIVPQDEALEALAELYRVPAVDQGP